MAATNLAKCIQRLYQNRENDKMADFVIESSDGKQIKVHPLILLSRGSDFLEKMLTSEFREKNEKRLKVPMSFKATTAFVEYIYGFDAGEEDVIVKNEPNNDEEDADDDGDNSLNLDTIKELILVAGIYEDTLKDYFGDFLKSYLTKENVFDTLEFLKENDATVGVKNCQKFIVTNFSGEELLENGHLDENPDTALEMVKHKCSHRDSADKNYVKINEEFLGFRFDTWQPFESKLLFSVDTDITVTGVGLVLSPGSDVTVSLELGGNRTTKRVRNTGEDDVVPVYFETPLRLACDTRPGVRAAKIYWMTKDRWKIKASIQGKGVARVQEDEDEVDDYGGIMRNYDEVKVDGRNRQGNRVGEVKFEFHHNSSNIFSKLYFYVNSEARPSQPKVLAEPQPGPSRQQDDYGSVVMPSHNAIMQLPYLGL